MPVGITNGKFCVEKPKMRMLVLIENDIKMIIPPNKNSY